MHDGMETNINSRQTENTFSGADGYRPTLNSYLYADEQAISKAAALLGDSATAREFAARAAALKRRGQQSLWGPPPPLFFHPISPRWKGGKKTRTPPHPTGPQARHPPAPARA